MRNLTNWLLLCVIVLLAFVVFQHRKAQKMQGRTRRFSLVNGSVLVFDNNNGMLCSAVTQEALAEDLQTVQSSLKKSYQQASPQSGPNAKQLTTFLEAAARSQAILRQEQSKNEVADILADLRLPSCDSLR